MPSIGSMTKTVRFYADDLEKIDELVRDGATFSGAVHQLIEKSDGSMGVPSKIMGIIGEFDEMASCCGMTTEELVGGLLTMLEEGEIVIEGGRLMPSMPDWALELENACHEKGVDTKDVAGKVVVALKRGEI